MGAACSDGRVLWLTLTLALFGCAPANDDDATGADDDDATGADDDDATPNGPFEEACLATPDTPSEGWTGPLSDSHVHTTVFPNATQEEFATRLLEEMNRSGVQTATVIGPHVTHFANNLDWLRGLEEEWGGLIRRCDRLLFQLNAFEPEDPDAAEYVALRLDEAPYAGVGAVDLVHPFSSSSPDAAGLGPVLDLLEERGLPFQFHGITNDDDAFIDRMLEIADARPGLSLVWFGCPDAVLAGPPRDNLVCPVLPFSLECPAPCDGAERAALDHMIVGLDIGPVGFNPWDEGASPFPYESFEGGVAEARAALGQLPEEAAASIAHARYDAAF